MEISGKPMIHHIIKRAEAIKMVDEMILATSVNRADNILADWARENKVNVFRGSENNVLDRFLQAAKKTDADIVVRICADSPLFDPKQVDGMIRALLKEKGDFVKVVGDALSVSGVNVFSSKGLLSCALMAELPHEREHVIPYFLKNPSLFKFVNYKVPKVYERHGLRLTVDTSADLELIRKIYKDLYKPNTPVDLLDVIEFLDRNPHLLKINSHVRGISKNRPGFKILILIVANKKTGWGHLFRMIKLAEILTERFANSVKFAVVGDKYSKDMLLKKNFAYVQFSKSLVKKIDKLNFDAIIIDSHNEKLSNFFAKFKGDKLKVSYDDAKNGKFSNLAFEPTNLDDKDRKLSFSLYKGLEYLILRNISNSEVGKRKLVLISAGAGDNNNFILKIANKLKVPENLQLALLIGPMHNNIKRLEQFKKRHPEIKVFEKTDPFEVFARTKIAICYFGVTMFEMIASKIVCAVFAVNADHMRQIRKFSKIGFVYNLGYFKDKMITEKIGGFLTENKLIKELSSNTRGKIDSKGVLRVAQVIQSRLLEKHI